MSNEAKWRIEYSKYSTYCNIIDADGYVGTIQGREKAELIAKAPVMAAEIERLKDQLKDYCNDCQHPTVNEQQATELSKLRQENAEYAVAQKGNLARLDQLNALVKSIWEVLEIPSPLIFKETANNIPLLDFIKGLKQENNDLRKLTDEQFPE